MATAGKNLSSDYLKSSLDVQALKIGVVVSKWNNEITESLYDNCYQTLIKHRLSDKQIIKRYVPGSFELVYGAKKMLEANVYNAVITIGCVIKGETEHFTYICNAVSQGVKDLNINFKSPTIFCVLTDNTIMQSKDRSGGKYGNKGVEAALTTLEMIQFSS